MHFLAGVMTKFFWNYCTFKCKFKCVGDSTYLKNLAPCFVICILEGLMIYSSDASWPQLIIKTDYLKKSQLRKKANARQLLLLLTNGGLPRPPCHYVWHVTCLSQWHASSSNISHFRWEHLIASVVCPPSSSPALCLGKRGSIWRHQAELPRRGPALRVAQTHNRLCMKVLHCLKLLRFVFSTVCLAHAEWYGQ